jgi:ribosomal protein S18 acetylase RimI-like enzyme
VVFRDITSADVPSLFYVRTRTRENRLSLEELTRLGITETSVNERLSSSHKGWLCEIDNAVVGFCMADRSAGELWVIAVLPDFECMGVGNGLMSLAEGWLWACGCDGAWLTTDVDTTLRAYGFYRNRGWVDWKMERGLRYMRLLRPQPA